MIRPDYSQLPLVLQLEGRFLPFRVSPRKDKPGKTDKIPYDRNDVKTGTDDPSAWLTFDEALALFEDPSKGYAGIGILQEPWFRGCDLDDCVTIVEVDGRRRPQTDPEKRALALSLGGWVEYSQSGTGLHILGLPPDGPDSPELADHARGVEYYTGASRRFVALTGRVAKLNGHAPEFAPINAQPLIDGGYQIARGSSSKGLAMPEGFDPEADVTHIRERLSARDLACLDGDWGDATDRSRRLQGVVCNAMEKGGATDAEALALLHQSEGAQEVARSHRSRSETKAEQWLLKQVVDAARKVPPERRGVRFDVLDDPADDMSDILDLASPAPAAAPAAPAPTADLPAAAMPPALLDVSDLPVLQEFCECINDSCYYPQPGFTLVAALTLVAAALGNNFVTPSGSAPNLFATLVGPTGSGKDAPQHAVGRILAELGLDGRLAGSTAASTAGIEEMLAEPGGAERIFCFDEFGKILQGIANNSDPQNVGGTLLRIYSASHGVYKTRRLAKQPSVTVLRPAVSILGGTTPGALAEALSGRQVEAGWLGRLLVTPTATARPQANRARHRPLGDVARTWGSVVGTYGLSGLDPVRAVYAPGVEDLSESYQQALDARLRAESMPETTRAALVRNYEHIVKISTMRAFLRDPEAPIILERDVRWAAELVQWSANFVIHEFLDQIGVVIDATGQRMAKIAEWVEAPELLKSKQYQAVLNKGAIPIRLLSQKMRATMGQVRELVSTMAENDTVRLYEHKSKSRNGATSLYISRRGLDLRHLFTPPEKKKNKDT